LLSQILHPSIPTNTRKQQRLCLHSSITSGIIREICHLLHTFSRSNESMSIGWCTKSVHVSHTVRSRKETSTHPRCKTVVCKGLVLLVSLTPDISASAAPSLGLLTSISLGSSS
jgi:hypothetical protein